MADLMDFDQFRNWALSQGSVAKYNDGGYLGECVSLINQYCWRVLNIPADAWGHAKDWGINSIQRQYFDALPPENPQRGDILVYGAGFGSGRGHIEIATDGAHALYQNRNFDGRVGTGLILQGYYVILRKKENTVDNIIRDEKYLHSLWWHYIGNPPLQDEVTRYLNKASFSEVLDILMAQKATKDFEWAGVVGKAAIVGNWQGRLEKLQAETKDNSEVKQLLAEILSTLKKKE